MPQPFIDFVIRNYMSAIRKEKFMKKEEMKAQVMSEACICMEWNRKNQRPEIVDFYLVRVFPKYLQN